MDLVSVYEIGGGGDRAYVFGGAVGVDLSDAVWLGRLPIRFVEAAGSRVALAGDRWLTTPVDWCGCACGRGVAGGDVVTALDAAKELVARGEGGLTAFTNRSGDVSGTSSVALLVAEDLVAGVERLRSGHAAWVASVDDVERELADLDARQCGPSGDSPARRVRGRALRDLRAEQARLRRVIEAAVRIGVFDADGEGRSRPSCR